MSEFPKNHEQIYFDKLIRRSKMETALSFIYAAYNAGLNHPTNDEEYRKELKSRLVHAYELIREKGTGTYQGTDSQFESQYTLGHELCIWKNSSLRLTDFAKQVAENHITIREYFDIFFLNYVQPVNQNNIHILYQVLKYLNDNGVDVIHKQDLPLALGVRCPPEMINAVCYFLNGTSFFVLSDNNSILSYVGKHSVSSLISFCNLTYMGEKGYEKSQVDFCRGNGLGENNYCKYISQIPFERKNDIDNRVRNQTGENVIYYGAPGCGKSHFVNEKYDVIGNKVFRTVFYPDYSNSDFIGTVLPVVDQNDSHKISYEFQKGIFTQALVFAYEHPTINTILIVEEINRGNAAAIFGDIFQLLDRKADGSSVYRIKNDYIAHEISGSETDDVFVPSNMSIIATMNTSDQNVFTLDTAFKRRWKMVKIRNSFSDLDSYSSLPDSEKKELFYKYDLSCMYIPGSSITWREFVEKVNEKISELSKTFLIASEDKQIGVFFVGMDCLSKTALNYDSLSLKKFGEKVLMYLWNDVAKTNTKMWFGDKKDLDQLLDSFENSTVEKGDSLSVFSNSLFCPEKEGEASIPLV